MKTLISFLSEDSGKLSFMRISAFLLILTYIFVAIYIALTEHKLIDMPIQLASLIVLLYGINKFSNSKNDFKTNIFIRGKQK